MEQFFKYKKPKLNTETNEEFYLNPKDMINNDKIYDSTFPLDVMYYLPLNELLIILFEGDIVVVDIKRTISKNFTIIKKIHINDLYKTHFKFIPEEKKNAKLIVHRDFSTFCYKFKENDLDKIKNFSFVEIKNNLNTVYFLVEFLNLDFLIIKYDNINNQAKYDLVYSHTKNIFLKLGKNMKFNYESSLIFNYRTCVLTLNEKIQPLNFYVFHLCENKIFIFNFSDMKYKYITKLETDFEIKNIIADFFQIEEDQYNHFIFYTVSTLNLVQKIVFNFSNKKIIENTIINNTDSFENEGNITLIKFDFLQKIISKVVLFAQMNKIYIYDINNNNLIKSITFSLFEDWVISYCFIQSDDILYIFNSNGEYAYNQIEQREDDEINITNSSCQSLVLSKQIYSIKQFETKIGFFILSTQTPIKLLNSNVTYLIPDIVTKKTTIDSLIEDNFFNKTSFFSFSLSEFLIFALRFSDTKKLLVSQEKDDIITQRIKFYIKYILDPNSTSQYSITDYSNALLNYYKSINDIKTDNYIKYLGNDEYKCDFCNEHFVKFNLNSKSYTCNNNHETFSCSVTQIPFNENFLHCDTCSLFYSNTFKICLICQQMLSCAI